MNMTGHTQGLMCQDSEHLRMLNKPGGETGDCAKCRYGTGHRFAHTRSHTPTPGRQQASGRARWAAQARGGDRLGSHTHTLGQPRPVRWHLRRRDIPFPWDLRPPLGMGPEAHIQHWEDMWTVILVSRHPEPGTIGNHCAVAWG